MRTRNKAVAAGILVLAVLALVSVPAAADVCGDLGGGINPVNGECQITINGTVTVPGGTYDLPQSLRIFPTATLAVAAAPSGATFTLNIAGNLTIDAPFSATKIAVSGNSSSVGATIAIVTSGNITVETNALGTMGGQIASNGPTGCPDTGSARAGNVSLTSVAGHINLKGSSQVNALGGCLGGTIAIRALAGNVNIAGKVTSRGGATISTTRVVRGGPITVAAAADLTVAPGAQIVSDSRVTGDPFSTVSGSQFNYGADLVHLESGANTTIMGVVQSAGGFSYGVDVLGRVNRCTMPQPDGKRNNPTACVEVWVGGTLTMNAGDPALGNANAVTGRLLAKSGSSSFENSLCCTWIDVFVKGDITLTGQPSTVSSNAHMINAEQGSKNAFGGVVTIRSYQGKIDASGRTVLVDGASEGGHGGIVVMEAAGPRVYPPGIFHAADLASNVNLGDSLMYARGSTVGGTGGAGNILIRSYNGQITGGPPDRPGTERGGCIDRYTGEPLIDPSTGQQYPCDEFAGTLNAAGQGLTELIVTLCDGWQYNGITVPRTLTSGPTCGGTPPPPPESFPVAPTIKIYGGVYQYDGFERPATGDHARPLGDQDAGFIQDPLAGLGHRIARVVSTAFGQPGLDINGIQLPPLPDGSLTPALALLPLPTVTYVDSTGASLPSALNPFPVPVNVGTYTATAYFPGNAVYTGLIATAPITIFAVNRPTPIVRVTGGIYQYDGQPHPATGPTGAVGTLPTTEDAATNAFIATPGVYYSKYTEGSNVSTNCAFDPTPGWTPQTDTKCTTTPPVLTTTTKTPPSVTLDDGIPVLAYFPGNTTYGPAWATAKIAIWNSRPSVTTTTGGTFVYDGMPHATTTAVRDAASSPAFPTARANVNDAAWTFNGQPSGVTYRAFDPLNPNLSALGAVSVDAPINVGTYPVTAWYPGDSTHSGSYGTNVIIITPRPATISVASVTVACDGSPYGLTGTIRDVTLDTVLVGATPALSYSYLDSSGNTITLAGPPTAAGVYTVTASLPQSLASNYSAPSVTATLTITAQTATITVTGGSFTWDGNPHPATTGFVAFNGLAIGTPTLTYTNNAGGAVLPGAPVDVGTYTVTATWSSAGTCYTATPAAATITITAPSCTIPTTGPFAYTPIAYPANGAATSPYGLDSAGHIVGAFVDNTNQSSGFRLSGPAGDYSSPIHATALDAVSTAAYGVNLAGQIVGTYLDSAGRAHGFILTGSTGGVGGTFTRIDVPPSFAATQTMVYGINNNSAIVGAYVGPDGKSHGFALSRLAFDPVTGAPTNLGTTALFARIDATSLGAVQTVAYGINNNGLVVGVYIGLSGKDHGFSAQPLLGNVGDFTGATYKTVDVPGAVETRVYGVDDAGRLVGSYDDSTGIPDGFLFDGSAFTVFGSDGSEAHGINNAGQIVGNYVSATTSCGFLTQAPSLCTSGKCATRTPGFWANHTEFTERVFDTVGIFTVGTSTHMRLIDSYGKLFGALISDIAKLSTGVNRPALEQSRMQLLQHLIAAKLNCTGFGCSSAIRQKIANADIVYGGNNDKAIKDAIGDLNNYNRSNDKVDTPPALGSQGSSTPDLSRAVADIVYWDTP